ncbi:MAG: hypothetical protein JXM74_05690 [Fusobacteriaceae bacterium]|nr:hypothetical protein [Fusobacteriaceae bacterium]
MKKLLVFFSCISLLLANTYELKLNELEILKQNKEKYIRQKNISYSEFEKLQLDEKVIQKELEIAQFIQQRLEEKNKYEARLDELNQLISLLSIKDSEISKKYDQLKVNTDGISKLDLDKMYSGIQINRNQIKKSQLEKEYITYLLSTEEYSKMENSLKKDKIIIVLENFYNALIDVKTQEVKVTEIEKKGDTLIKIKKLELDLAQEEKVVTIMNHEIKMKDFKNKYDILLIDKANCQNQIDLLVKEQDILDKKVSLGAASNKEFFDKVLEKYEKMEEKVRIEGEIKLKEIELNQ